MAPTHYVDGQEVWVDVSVGKVGNERKLGINRKRGIIIDKISQNAYIVKYDDGKVEPMNVDRLYTLSKVEREGEFKTNKTKGNNSHRHFKQRARKRKLKECANNKKPIVKRQRLNQ